MSGKAWHHIAMHSSDSLIIKHGGDLPKMYEHVNQKLGANERRYYMGNHGYRGLLS